MNIRPCEHNKMIDCDEKKCGNCGWNPVVKIKRVNDWKKNMAQKEMRKNAHN